MAKMQWMPSELHKRFLKFKLAQPNLPKWSWVVFLYHKSKNQPISPPFANIVIVWAILLY